LLFRQNFIADSIFAAYIDIANLPQGADIDSDFIGTNGVFAAWGSTSGGLFTLKRVKEK